jgi:hypothetical protein
MGITATYKTPAVTYKDAYFRIQRIWGSKEEGWNAWIAVFAKEGDKEQKEIFSVNVPYVEDENPFVALYKKAESLSFVITKDKELIPPVPVNTVVEPIVEEVTATEPVAKKTKVKKVKK